MSSETSCGNLILLRETVLELALIHRSNSIAVRSFSLTRELREIRMDVVTRNFIALIPRLESLMPTGSIQLCCVADEQILDGPFDSLDEVLQGVVGRK
ncbi:hypothetical protein Tco_0255646 [Tanacetum coccineum]